MKNKALLVGINKYPNPRNELKGCVNDILDMGQFITETNKIYEKENVKLLTDKNAHKKEIVAHIKWLMEGAESGDQLLFHYSGHGAQVPSHHSRIEKDGLDEIICPYDFDGSPGTTLSDKEFAQLFESIPKGVHFVWISDSCHAADLSRDPFIIGETNYRTFHGISTHLNEPVLNPIYTSGDIAEIIKPLKGALLSACASNELSADALINNRYNGAFTHYLINNLAKYGESQPMNKIIEFVNTDLNKNGYDQNPESEGLLENKTFFM
jgi:hypothetical protein